MSKGKRVGAMTIPKELTIRQVEESKLENVRNKQKDMKAWGIYRYPTPTKRIKSLSMLRKRIEEFFASHDDDADTEDLPTPSQLAVFLGYPSASAMFRDINSPEIEPEYAMLLDRAVDILKDNMQRRQLRFAEIRKDWQGVDAVLNRMEREIDKSKPDEAKTLNININIEKQERIKSFLSERMDQLMADAEYEEVEDQKLLENTDGIPK